MISPLFDNAVIVRVEIGGNRSQLGGSFLNRDPPSMKQTTVLIDFGATREFPKTFVDGYLRIV